MEAALGIHGATPDDGSIIIDDQEIHTLSFCSPPSLSGAAVYYFDWKRGQKEAEKSAEDNSKAAFSDSDRFGDCIRSFSAGRRWMARRAISFRKAERNLANRSADSNGSGPASDGNASSKPLAARASNRRNRVPPDRLKVYGLDPPAVSVEFKLQEWRRSTH